MTQPILRCLNISREFSILMPFGTVISWYLDSYFTEKERNLWRIFFPTLKMQIGGIVWIEEMIQERGHVLDSFSVRFLFHLRCHIFFHKVSDYSINSQYTGKECLENFCLGTCHLCFSNMIGPWKWKFINIKLQSVNIWWILEQEKSCKNMQITFWELFYQSKLPTSEL